MGKLLRNLLKLCSKTCPEKLKILNNISLSRQTITRRTCDIADDLSLSLTEKIKAFQYYSIAIDESTDISKTAQLAIFIRGIDNDFLVTEELLDIYPMQGRTTGEDIFLALKKVFKKFNLTYNRLISITSDGGSSMIGKKKGVVSRLENEMAENNLSLMKLHCIIHQQNLTAKTMDVENVISVVVKAINSIKSSALRSRQFEAFLAENDSEYGGLLYYTEVRWLSRGNMLKRTYDLRQNMLDFFKIINKDYPPELEEKDFIKNFAFLVDLTQHYNILNKELQGKDQLIGKMYNLILAFQLKLTLWEQQLRTGNFSHFPTLGELNPGNTAKFVTCIAELKTRFSKRFADVKNHADKIQLFTVPFSADIETVPDKFQMELIDLQCSDALREAYNKQNLLLFYKNLDQNKYTNLVNNPKMMGVLFGSTYLCESVFSRMKFAKSKTRSVLTDTNLQNTLRIATSQLPIGIKNIVKKRQVRDYQ